MKIEVSNGKIIQTGPKSESLMKILLDNQVPVASSCNGDGICGKCKIEVVSGSENLTTPNETEELLRKKFRLGKQFRISCQCQVLGDVSLRTSYW